MNLKNGKMKINRNTYEKIKEKFLYVFTFILGIVTFLTIVYALNEFGIIHLIDPEWQYYANNPKPDGNVYLYIGNQTDYGKFKPIQIGHQQVIDLCRGQKYGEPTNTTFMGFNVSCKEKFEGCGAINCECWVIE